MKKIVIFIHGWENSSKSFNFISKEVQKMHDVLLIDYNTKNIEKFEDLLNPIIKKIKNIENEYNSFIFIGHSFGGIISKFLIDKFKNKTSKLITLGTPHRGSEFVRFMKNNKILKYKLDKISELLSTDSQLIKNTPNLPKNIKFICFSGSKKFSIFYSPSYISLFFQNNKVMHDGMVTVDESSTTSSDNYIFRENHSRLPYNNDILNVKKKEL